ncbi:hypothetical protein [uncultured Ferrimonas sp.]|uniref:hypothetical protein n=1 Tax=uncultured Ferrimonas sp. TaxID=432640 RepID=UPI00262DAA4F|nr:hypothetical protein [uncultured Ferrimonas sp.]
MNRLVVLLLLVSVNASAATLVERLHTLPLLNQAQLITHKQQQFVVAVGDAELNNDSARAKINAIKVARAQALAALNRFIHGEQLHSRDVALNGQLTSRIRAHSRGVLNQQQQRRWPVDGGYRVAIVLPILDAQP